MGEVTENRAGGGAQCGRGHITGGRCHLSHPVLSQTEALGPVFKPDQLPGSFFNTKTSSSGKRNRGRAHSSVCQTKECTTAQPSICGGTPQVYSNLCRHYEGHTEPNEGCRGALVWAARVRLLRTALHTLPLPWKPSAHMGTDAPGTPHSSGRLLKE